MGGGWGERGDGVCVCVCVCVKMAFRFKLQQKKQQQQKKRLNDQNQPPLLLPPPPSRPSLPSPPHPPVPTLTRWHAVLVDVHVIDAVLLHLQLLNEPVGEDIGDLLLGHMEDT